MQKTYLKPKEEKAMKASSTSRARFLTRMLQGAAVAGALALGVMGLSSQSIAATAANTTISNQATVKYVDENSNPYEAQSNVASIKVKQIYTATLQPDRIAKVTAGQLVYFQHTLSNTGNGQETFAVTIAEGNTAVGAWTGPAPVDDADFSPNTLKVFYDINANGQVDPGEPELTGALNKITLDQAGDASIVIQAQIPVAGGNTEIGAVLTVTGGNANSVVTDVGGNLDGGVPGTSATNHDLAIITTDAVLNVRKSAVVTPPADAASKGTITFTVVVTNTGTTDAQHVVLWDGIPNNTTYKDPSVSSVGFGGGTDGALARVTLTNGFETDMSCIPAAAAVYKDLDGNGASTGVETGEITSAIGTKLANFNDGTAIDVNNNSATTDTIKGLDIVCGYDALLPVNNTIQYSYTVEYNGSLAAGTNIVNVASVCADVNEDNALDGCDPSNEVVVITPPFPALQFSDTGTLPVSGNGGDMLIATVNGVDGATATAGETAGGGKTDNDIDEAAAAAWGGTGYNGIDTHTAAQISDIQYRGVQAAGSTVEFLLRVRNFGNIEDTFELSVTNAPSAKLEAYVESLAILETDVGVETGVAGDADATHVSAHEIIAFQNSPAGGAGQEPIFSYWDETGNTQLLDTNGDGIQDTGPIASSGNKTIMVKLKLPSDYAGNFFHSATVTATSAKSTELGEAPVKSNDAQLLVGRITLEGVDAQNGTTYDVAATPADTVDHTTGGNTAPFTFRTAGDAPVTVKSANVGATVTFDFVLKNKGGAPDAFQINAGSYFGVDDPGTPTAASAKGDLGPMHAGWSVIFKDAACGGAGNIITSTPAIAPLGTFNVCAYVTVSADPTQAVANLAAYDYDNADFDSDTATGTLDNVDFNSSPSAGDADGDGDYPIFFQFRSQNSGSVDVKLDAVDVNDLEDVSCSPNNSNQVQPGGSVDYPHLFKNSGNTVEQLKLSGANSYAGFSSITYVTVDDSNDGVPGGTTTLTAWDLVPVGVWVVLQDGSLSKTVDDGAAKPLVPLSSGQQIPATVRVFAPSNVPNGTSDTMTLTGTYNGATATKKECFDTTSIILGQVRLIKQVAVDVNCNGDLTDLGDDAVYADQKDAVIEPGQCAVWAITATNEGDAVVDNVVIYDAAPAYTLLKNAGTNLTVERIETCSGTHTACAAWVLHSVADDDGAVDRIVAPVGADGDCKPIANTDASGNVVFYVGTNVVDGSGTAPCNGLTQKGGTLAPGASYAARFWTIVE